MGKSTTLFVGLDVHKDSIDIGVCEAGWGRDVRHLGTVAGSCEAVTKALRRQLTGGKIDCTSLRGRPMRLLAGPPLRGAWLALRVIFRRNQATSFPAYSGH